MTGMIRRRRVFYISGFDPRGAGHYHRLYRAHAVRQSAVNGMLIDVSLRQKLDDIAHAWQVRARDDGAHVETQVEFLAWDDIVRAQWSQDLKGLARDFRDYLRAHVLSGMMHRHAAAARGRVRTVYYPLFYFLAAVFLSCAAGWALWGWSPLAAVVLAGLVLRGAYALGDRLAAFWILRLYAFCARWAETGVEGLDERISAMAARIRAAVKDEDVDEVLVVAHSIGAMVSVPVMARVLEDAGLPAGKCALVTLGHCIPLLSCHEKAGTFRRDLKFIAHDPRLLWVDYTAPADGISMPRVDPVTASGLEKAPGAGPRILSPRFYDLFDRKTYRRLKLRLYTMHFLYMMSTDIAGGYDYFAMTAGAQPLAARLGEG